MPLIKHFTNAENLSNIYADGIIKLEGSNIENAVRKNVDAVHPSGMPLNSVWKAMKMQYKLVGRYVWLTEESDVKCITVQRKFSKKAFVFEAEAIGAKRWMDVAKQAAFKSKKARKFIKAMNESAIANGDDVRKWWVVAHEISLEKSLPTNEELTLNTAA